MTEPTRPNTFAPNLAQMRSLNMRWTCLVCRCTEATEPKRKCRVLCRKRGEMSLFHADSQETREIVKLAAQGRPSEPGALAEYATRLSALVYHHFGATYDDVICEKCDSDRVQFLGETIADFVYGHYMACADPKGSPEAARMRLVDMIRQKFGTGRDD